MSNSHINVFYELEINDGQANEVREIVKQMVAFNYEGEPETLVYNVYISADEKLLTYWETHASNDAIMFHADRFANGSYVGQILERTGAARLCFYGDTSDDMKTWATDNGFEIEYAELVDGFVRYIDRH